MPRRVQVVCRGCELGECQLCGQCCQLCECDPELDDGELLELELGDDRDLSDMENQRYFWD